MVQKDVIIKVEKVEKMEEQNKIKMKYRYVLIVILAIIIILLVSLISLFFRINKDTSKREIPNENISIDENILTIGIKENSSDKKNEENKNENNSKDVQQKSEEQVIQQNTENEADLKANQNTENEPNSTQNDHGIIYLTFDDGPSLDSTPKILDILKNNNIKATFFVIHYSEEKENLVKREYMEGHTVALHGYSHDYSIVYQSADACINNFRKIQEDVYNSIGVKSNIIRFPGGSSNTVSRKYSKGVMTELTTRVLEDGFHYFDWNVDSDDAGKAKTSDDIYNNVTSKLKQNRSNVVLMHDFSGNNKTIDALNDIIKYGKENGYIFKKITYETPMVKHGVNN